MADVSKINRRIVLEACDSRMNSGNGPADPFGNGLWRLPFEKTGTLPVR
jgi:hypothetical protein